MTVGAIGVLVVLSGCGALRGALSEPPIPRELVTQVAPDLAALGHPNGTFQEARVAGWSAGRPEDHARWVDLEIRYTRRQRPEPHTMTVRIYHERIEPCRMAVDVLADDGPEPILLDNGLASSAIGTELCDRLPAPPS